MSVSSSQRTPKIVTDAQARRTPRRKAARSSPPYVVTLAAAVSYYVRAFCTSADLPPLQSVLDWAKSQGVELEAPNADLTAPNWEQAEITYAPDKGPLVAEVSRGDDLLQEEVEEFRELLEDADDSTDKDGVLGHLDRTEAVVALQLLGDRDDAGYTAAGTVLDYYVQHCGGLVQADGEGFYDGERLIVALE